MKQSSYFPMMVSLCVLYLTGCGPRAEVAQAGKGDWPEFPKAAPLEESGVPDPYAKETREQRDARMAWWRYAKFGMFIHWGIYAVPAGTYNDKQIGGIGEWIMLRGKIPVAEYRAYAQEFNPVQYDPASWAALAREAGMKYMVITSKHHDGFALFPSEVTDWDVADATPYKKDLIAPLAKAARAEGLKFGLYYSQAQDWTHPGGAKAGKEWDEAHKGDMDQYIEGIAVPQVKEILTRYTPDVLWWDTPTGMNPQRAEKLAQHLRLVPGIIHNNRLGGEYKGDTETPEQRIPATGFVDRDWEVCMTMNDTWGFKSYDDRWKPTQELIHKLCDIVSKGGNFLLNVGPTQEGLIPQPSIDRLKEVGAWMNVNGEAIYGTTASPFGKFSWGRCTAKLREDGATLYLHVFEWPADGKLIVPGLKTLPASATLLAGGAPVNAQAYQGEDGEGIMLEVPAQAPDAIASVIKLSIAEKLVAVPSMPRQAADGTVTLTPGLADIHNSSYESSEHIRIETLGTRKNIGNWTHAPSWVGWSFMMHKPGTYTVQAEIAAEQDTRLNYGLKGVKGEKAAAATSVDLKATGGNDQFTAVTLGELEIAKVGEHELELKPVKEAWKPLNLRNVTLTPKP